MAERKGHRTEPEEDFPIYLARPGTAEQVPRQKYGGVFCSVEDAFESKTIDFEALSVGQKGCRTPRSARREPGREARSSVSDSRSSAGSGSPAERKKGRRVSPPPQEKGTSGGEGVLQHLHDGRDHTDVGLQRKHWKTELLNRTLEKWKKNLNYSHKDKHRRLDRRQAPAVILPTLTHSIAQGWVHVPDALPRVYPHLTQHHRGG